jgi:hypothetical protein
MLFQKIQSVPAETVLFLNNLDIPYCFGFGGGWWAGGFWICHLCRLGLGKNDVLFVIKR